MADSATQVAPSSNPGRIWQWQSVKGVVIRRFFTVQSYTFFLNSRYSLSLWIASRQRYSQTTPCALPWRSVCAVFKAYGYVTEIFITERKIWGLGESGLIEPQMLLVLSQVSPFLWRTKRLPPESTGESHYFRSIEDFLSTLVQSQTPRMATAAVRTMTATRWPGVWRALMPSA